VVRRGHEIRLVHFPLDCKPEQLTEAQLEPGLTTIGFSRWRGQLFANCKRMCELAEWADVIHFAQSDFRSALPAVYASYMLHKPLHYDWDRWDLAQYKNAPGRKPLFGRHAWLIEEALMPGLADTVSARFADRLAAAATVDEACEAVVDLIVSDLCFECAMDGVVFEQVGIDRTVAQIIDGDDLQILTVALGIQCAQDITADTAKTIDCDTKSHWKVPVVDLL